MNMDMVENAAIGAGFQEGMKHAVGLVYRGLKFRRTHDNLGSAVHGAIPKVQEISRLNQELDRPEEEMAPLLKNLRGAENVYATDSDVPWWKFCCFPWKQLKAEEALRGVESANNHLIPTVLRETKETRLEVREGFRGTQLKDPFKAPTKPDLVVGVGLDNPSSPFNKVKMRLLQTGNSVHVLAGITGSGKTTLATLLCLDDDVKGKFGENILFLDVSQTRNLKSIVRSLFQHHRCHVPYIHPKDDDLRTISHLKNLPKEIMKSPMLLVLDDVSCGSEPLIEAFKVQQLLDYKILVTSSSINISEFEHVYRPKSLCLEDSVTLFHHLALQNEGGSSLSKDHTEKLNLTKQIVKACCGSPLLLELVGGFLKKKHVRVWRQMTEKLSEGSPIVKSHIEMRNLFKKYFDVGLEDKPMIKECFMDLGLFPKNQKIPVAALIDIWTERKIKSAENFDVRQGDAVNFVYDLIDRYLANLVVKREAASDLDDYYNHHFLMQHNLHREMIEVNQEPYKERERLMFDMNEDNWSQQISPNTISHTLSISNCEMSTPKLDNIVKVEVVEVLVLNLCTNLYTFPEFIKKMNKKLKVLIVTNYDDFHYSELNNFGILDFLSELKRIRLERVLVTTFCKWHNLRKLSLYNCYTKEAFESNHNKISISEAMPNLVELCMDYCRDLVQLPAKLFDIASIEKLSITRCMVFIDLPQEIGKLKNLKILRLSSCAEFRELPASIGKLRQLHFLDISGCVSLDNLPDEIGDLVNLKRLHMTGCSCKKPPFSVEKLKELRNVICDEESAMYWKDFETSLPNLKIEEANDHSLFISYDNI